MVISVAPYSAQIKTVFKNILIFHILGSSNDQMAGAGIKEESNCIFSGAQGVLGNQRLEVGVLGYKFAPVKHSFGACWLKGIAEQELMCQVSYWCRGRAKST